MPATPRRSGSSAPEGSRYPSEVLADNIRGHRSLQRMSQQGLADSMRDADHPWHRATVSEVERAGRYVSTDELVTLALVLGVTIADLLDPAGPTGKNDVGLYVGDVDYGEGRQYLPPRLGQLVARSAGRAQLSRTPKGAMQLTVDLTRETLEYLGEPVEREHGQPVEAAGFPGAVIDEQPAAYTPPAREREEE